MLKYFAYLRLEPNKDQQNGTVSTTPNYIKRPRPGALDKFLTIDLTSPLGQYIFKSSRRTHPRQRARTTPINFELLCSAATKRDVTKKIQLGFPVSWKSPRGYLKRVQHQYSFTSRDKWRKRVALETGLTPRSLWLYRQCKRRFPAVKLRRLSMKEMSMKIL